MSPILKFIKSIFSLNFSHLQHAPDPPKIWSNLSYFLPRILPKIFIPYHIRQQVEYWPIFVPSPPPPPPIKRVQDQHSCILTYIGHSTILIQTPQCNIITDPNLSLTSQFFGFFKIRRIHQPGVDFENLPQIDAILVSHNHPDCFDKKTFSRIAFRDRSTIFSGSGFSHYFHKRTSNYYCMQWWDAIPFLNTSIQFVPSLHTSGTSIFNKNASLWGGFLIRSPFFVFYFAGDTAFGSHFSLIQKMAENKYFDEASEYNLEDSNYYPYEPQISRKDAYKEAKVAVENTSLVSFQSPEIKCLNDKLKTPDKEQDHYKLYDTDYQTPIDSQPIDEVEDHSRINYRAIENEKIKSQTSKRIDIAFLPIGGYAPYSLKRNFHMTPEDAVKAHLMLNAKQSIAINFDEFPRGSERYGEAVDRLRDALVKHSLPPASFLVLKPGQSISLKGF